jgi:SPP1 gp7 family putative phage head morphogenesis protein
LKTLPPQPLREQYWSDIEAQLKTMFYDIVFAPLIEIIRKTTPQANHLKEIYNAGGNLTSILVAIRSGRVQYLDGVFAGDFSVAISKDLRTLGATFDHRTKTFKMPVAEVPEFVRAEAALYQTVAKSAHEEMLRRLNEIELDLAKASGIPDIDAESAIRSIEKGWQKSARLLEVQPKLDRERTEALAADYNKNLKLYIQKFSQDSVKNLREAVEGNAQEGYRFDNLTEVIRHRYGVTANKAKFLARQETGLFMAKYRKQRFDQAGVRKYKWSTAHDERVRDSHKHLDGRVFAYDQPPVTDRATGAKNNPGEDFNCRCLDIPILEQDLQYA